MTRKYRDSNILFCPNLSFLITTVINTHVAKSSNEINYQPKTTTAIFSFFLVYLVHAYLTQENSRKQEQLLLIHNTKLSQSYHFTTSFLLHKLFFSLVSELHSVITLAFESSYISLIIPMKHWKIDKYNITHLLRSSYAFFFLVLICRDLLLLR